MRLGINRLWLPIVLVVVSSTGKLFFPYPSSRLKLRSRDTGSAVPSHVNLLIVHTQDESGAYTRTLLPMAFRDGVHLYRKPLESIPSLSGHAILYRWSLRPRVHRYKTSCPQQGSSRNGCCHIIR